MEIYRSTFRMMLNEAIKQQERIERYQLRYTSDSAYLATMREMFDKTESEDSIIYLKDDNV